MTSLVGSGSHLSTWALTTILTRSLILTPPPLPGTARPSTSPCPAGGGHTAPSTWRGRCSYLEGTMGEKRSVHFPLLIFCWCSDVPRSTRMTSGCWTRSPGPGKKSCLMGLVLTPDEGKLLLKQGTGFSCLVELLPTPGLLCTSPLSSWPCCPSRRRTTPPS